ncbi:MAG TPA: CBS domain-containing protein [Patescibacteria group bacterium]
MKYLSQLLGKPIIFHKKPFGKITDMTINEHEIHPSVTLLQIKKGKKEYNIPLRAVTLNKDTFEITSDELIITPRDGKELLLSEDLLDKQVIDLDGRRLVRVNDILLDETNAFTVSGLDIGIGGILRRLGLGHIRVANKILPWKVVEAFDYDTGNIRIKLKQNSLNEFHPAELADILEDVGTKERLGIVSSLDATHAAQAIEESDEETQLSILEGLTPSSLKEVLNNMHIAEIADVLHEINPFRLAEIQKILGAEKMKKLQGLSTFSDNTAGGLMHETFFQVESDMHTSEIIEKLRKTGNGECIVVVKNGQFLGTIQTKDLLFAKPDNLAQSLISNTKSLSPEDNFVDVIELFSQYNLRLIPVVDEEQKPLGVVTIDELLKVIEEENQKDDNH